ncbi:MAG: acyltransferase family protein, partial [Candidatus Helarchaeota archaeon]
TNSFIQEGKTTLKEIYSKSYFKKKLKRYLLPYIIFYIISDLIYLILILSNQSMAFLPFYDDRMFLFLGYTLFWGPGMWFIPIIFSSIFLIPIIYHFFIKEPFLTLFFCFVFEILFQLIIKMVYSFIGVNNTINFFYCNLFSYLSAIGLGLWFTRSHDIKDKQNKFILFFLPFCILYMIDFSFSGISRFIFLGDYNVFTFLYSAVLFLLAFKFLPEESDSKISSKFIKLVSGSTYHVFLFQVLYFSIIYHLFPDIAFNGFNDRIDLYLIYITINVIVSLSGGILWFQIEQRLKKKSVISEIKVR